MTMTMMAKFNLPEGYTLPERKIGLSAVVGAALTLLLGFIHRTTELVITGEEGAALAAVLMFVVAYMVKAK